MLALVLAIAALPAPPAPGDVSFVNQNAVQHELQRGQLAVDRIGRCMTERSVAGRLDNAYDQALGILRDTSEAAEALYPDIDPISETISIAGGRAPRCDGPSLRTYDAEARQAAVEARRLMQMDEALRAHGLWLGTLRLCGDRVESVAEGESEFPGESPVIVRFSLAFAPRVHALTAAFVTRRLPILLDGRIVVRPTVNEPVSHAISITSVDGTSVEQIRQAAARPC